VGPLIKIGGRENPIPYKDQQNNVKTKNLIGDTLRQCLIENKAAAPP
jgi:hypothetical protein